MISASDIVRLPYTPDLTEAGLIYARRVMPRLHSPSSRGLYEGVRRAAAAGSVQLALRRFLAAQGIPFGVQAARPFSDPDQYSVEIGGRRCELKSFLISRQTQIDGLAADPALALTAPALVPMDRLVDERLRSDDLYLFAFVSAATAHTAAATPRASSAVSGEFWLHALPAAWARPRTWVPLAPLALKSDAADELQLTLAGEDGSGAPLDVDIRLPARQRVVVDAPLYALSHIHSLTHPAARIGIHPPSHKTTYLISSMAWENVWLWGKEIYLLGWISQADFRLRATLIPEGRRVYQFERTKTKNLAVDVRSLRPIRQLLARVREVPQRGSFP